MYKKLLIFSLFTTIVSLNAQTNAPSIQSGVTFQWSDNQTNSNQPATIQSITVNGNVYFTFGAPTSYEMTQLGPAGHNINKIRLNGVNVEISSASATWNQSALNAFQSQNLNNYFEANGNGQNICDDYVAEETTNSQRQTLFYSGGIIASSSGVIAVTERNANNCYHIEFFGIPTSGGAEQSLGETFVNNGSTKWGFGGTGTSSNLGTPGAVNPPPAGSDYWLSDRVIENGGTIGIALFYLDDIAPTGSLITKATITSANLDNGDGKMFILTLPDQDNDGQSDVDDLDDDNDGINDLDESGNVDPSGDHDSDGLPNYVDPDFCTLNSSGVCANLDFDSDGIPNHFDKDSDNDGITDVVESNGLDTDKDGEADGNVGTAPTTLGIPQSAGAGNIPVNTDGVSGANFIDIDADDDGIPDNVELQDTFNYISPSGTATSITDINNDGIDDVYGTSLIPTDTDGDGIADYLDLDSDNDGKLDIEENGMGNIISNIDLDADGLDNNFEGGNLNDPSDVNDEINNPVLSILPDSDGDLNSGGDLDYRDLFDVNPPQSATIDFDGIDDYLTGNSVLTGLGNLTIMAWIKIDASNAGNSVAVIAGEDVASVLFIQNGNTLRFGLRTSSGTFTNLSGGSISYDEWHHVTGSFSNSTGKHSLYIDGELVNEKFVDATIGETLATTNLWNGNFEVGRFSRDQANQYYFLGNIDEVRVLDYALSDSQIQQMVYQEIENNSGFIKGKIVPKQIKDNSTNTTVPWNNLLAYYPFTDIKSGKTPDWSNNNNILQLMNIRTLQEQTAPLPYITSNTGDWSATETWLHGDVWDIEEENTNKEWSIVQIKHNVSTSESHTNLGLIIDSGKSLTVNGDNKIENNWYLELSGTIDLQGDSQLVQNASSDLVTSANGKVVRRQEGTSDKFWYNYWAAPVGTVVATSLTDNNQMANNNNNTTFNLGMLKTPSGSAFQFTNAYHETNKISRYWLYKYQNGVSYYDYEAFDENTALQPGVGYTQKGTGTAGLEQQYIFEGKPNNGTIIVPVVDTGGNGSVPAESKTDYLLGNPYPSALDLHQFIDDNIGVIDGTIQLWQQWSGSSHYLDEYDGGYAQVNKLGSIRAYQFVGFAGDTNGNQDGTKIPTRYLPVGQGFMTEIISDGNVVFKNGQRTFVKESDANGNYESGSVFFRGTSNSQNRTEQQDLEPEENPIQKIRLEFNSVNGPATKRELLLGFSEGTSDAYDYGYDAKILEENDDDLNLILGGERLTMQAYGPITEDKVVPLVLRTSGSYNYTIRVSDLVNIPEAQELYIKDNLTGEYFDLRTEGQPFEFSSVEGEFDDRLEIVFQQQQSETLSQIDQDLKELNLYYAIGRKKIVVLNPNSEALKGLEVVNMLGQSVARVSVFEGAYNEYEVPQLDTGTYIVNLTTATNVSITKKFIVK